MKSKGNRLDLGSRIVSRAIGILLCTVAGVACDDAVDAPESTPYEILLTLPHDTSAYTQGLLYHEQFLWESTGRFGQSTVRKVDGRTGQVVQSRALPDSLFGEGLALVGSELIQLTWKAGIALVYDMESLEVQRTLRYDGEGWGLCFDGEYLYMTNGSDSLYWRDAESFEVRGVVQVTAGGRPVRDLNELACVGDHVYANVFQQDVIVEISKASGRVERIIEGSRLRLLSGAPSDPEAVLNGTAHDPATDVFFLTGKLWPRLFVIRLLDNDEEG